MNGEDIAMWLLNVIVAIILGYTCYVMFSNANNITKDIHAIRLVMEDKK